MKHRIRILLGNGTNITGVKTVTFSGDELTLQEAEALIHSWVGELVNQVREYENNN
jgi:hypothetical protein